MVALVIPPYRTSTGAPGWITVPPQGYGAIQWVCAHLINGLIGLGHQVTLLGAPGSPARTGLTVADATTPDQLSSRVGSCGADVVHDHTGGLLDFRAVPESAAWISTHHLTGRPRQPRNCVYVSEAQRRAAGSRDAPVVPLPVNLAQFRFREEEEKEDYLLFLGRVSAHKGAYEAAAFAAAVGRRLVLAGPSWEPQYMAQLMDDHGDVVEVLGEVGGDLRLDLLSRARAVLVLSQPVMGPWGHVWSEPGATVVSEAAASGTPVVATRNGCLQELAAEVAAFVDFGSEGDPATAAAALASLPSSRVVRDVARRRWDHRTVASQYEGLYRRVLFGDRWDEVGQPGCEHQ